ncbi:hypothetical protein, partial [Xanthomonas campestris]|uniref:hypothetical protein n=2 Tax=Xanthomonas campestris TaxID=339 RepID=UPI001C8481CC
QGTGAASPHRIASATAVLVPFAKTKGTRAAGAKALHLHCFAVKCLASKDAINNSAAEPLRAVI